MKRILLTSASIVAFSGAAYAGGHASVTFGGDAEVGYNDEFNDGVFWSLGLSVAGSAELDNGLTASISGDVELDNADSRTFDGNDVDIDDLVIGLASDTASLKFGDTAPAADKMWSGVGHMDADSFNDEGDHGTIEDGVLIGEATLGSVQVGISYFVFDTNGGTTADDLDVLQLGVTGDLGAFSFGVAYQEDNSGLGGAGEIFGLRAATSLGGADVAFGYASEDVGGVSSLGVSVSYPVSDAVTVGAFYVLQDNDAGDLDDNYGISADYAEGPVTVGFLYHDGNDEDMQLNFTYDVGNGLDIFGGYRAEGSDQADIFYIGGDYDLGGGANVRVSFADVEPGTAGVDSALDELGAAEDVKEGFTLALELDF